MSFKLDDRLNKDCSLVADLGLSQLLLMDDANYPWLILVPRVDNISEMYELTPEHQQTLWTETAYISKLMKSLFNPTKINIGALGNIVRQLHVHIIARNEDDVAWPGPVWGAQPAKPYDANERRDLIKQITSSLQTPIST
ncbi:MAG: HIT family protein [Kangiellaceae bacterium]|jgi:diadenosine tetraphosphate (Ap4A) HIT family hydrolase|nr:HIT family protein [Kangiellaceae bacterium]